MPRWIQTLLAILLGCIAGLYYGWRVAPVEYVDLAPNTLRADYRAEYVLMVAEAYEDEADFGLVVHRLALLGSAPLTEIVQESLDTGNYTPEEVAILEELLRGIERWVPASSEVSP